MTVTVPASWSNSSAVVSGFTFPFPAARPLQTAVANTAGDWMVALVTWRQVSGGAGVTVSVADDAHNYWEPLGAPSGDSSAAGVTRTAIWYAPAARAAQFVQVAPTGNVLSLAVLILDVAGMSPWSTLSAINTGFGNATTSLSVGVGAPASSAFMLAVTGTDNLSDVISGPGGTWSAQSIVTATNGTDTTADLQLTAAWQTATTGQTANWTSSGTLDMSGVTAGILITGTAPAQASPNWPVVVTEVAPGAGVATPPSQITWTPISARSLAMTIQQGRQYTLGQLQAGQGTLTIDNPDGALIPPGTGSFAGIDSGTPVRQRMIWTGGAWQVQFTGNGTTASPQIDSHPGGFFPVTPGATYSAAAWIACSAPWASGFTVRIAWWNSGGTFISYATNSTPAEGPAPVFGIASGVAPGTAVKASVVLVASGTPPATTVFTAAAADLALGYSIIPPAVTWTAENSATLTTLAPWSPDPRGAPNPAPWYVPFSGYFQRWPFAFQADMLRGKTDATILDAWGYTGGTLDSMARSELLLDNPYALWPLNDPVGATSAANLAPGNSNPLTLVTSKLGAGGATQAFGANSSSGLTGDSSAKTTTSGKSGGGSGEWSQTLPNGTTSQNTQGYGYALVCADANFPPISGGVTIDGWFNVHNGPLEAFNAVTGSNTFAATASYTNGTPVALSVEPGFTLPGGFAANTVYYVVNVSGGTFQLSATLGGSAITVTSNGTGFIIATTPWNSVLWSARNVKGVVAEIDVSATNGNLILTYQSGGSTGTITLDTADYRFVGGMVYVSLAFNQNSYRAQILGFGNLIVTGNFPSPIPSFFTEFNVGGIQDRTTQGGAWSGYSALYGIYPTMLASVRTLSHYWAGAPGLPGEAPYDRIERILEYAELTGRRCLLQHKLPNETVEVDRVVSGQDIGGQPAATSVNNIAASTLPAMMYVAPTGDMFYLDKYHAWNQPVKWVLGDGAGEIPFKPDQFATDYDPSRVVNDIQLTQLDTSAITVPSGVMASTTMSAVEAASRDQYGDITYQQTGYLEYDASSAYTLGAGLNDLANWIASVYAKPRNRVQAVLVDAARHPSAWPFVAGASIGDMVTVNVRPPTAATSPLISLTARITQTNRSTQFDQASVAGSITCVLDFAPEYNTLMCDDAVRGLLNGQNLLGW